MPLNKSTIYHAPPTPVAISLAPTSVIDGRDETAISSHVCRGPEALPPLSSRPPNPSPEPSPHRRTLKVARKRKGVSIWPIVPAPPEEKHHQRRRATGDNHHEGNAAGTEAGRAPLVLLVDGPRPAMGLEMCAAMLRLGAWQSTNPHWTQTTGEPRNLRKDRKDAGPECLRQQTRYGDASGCKKCPPQQPRNTPESR